MFASKPTTSTYHRNKLLKKIGIEVNKPNIINEACFSPADAVGFRQIVVTMITEKLKYEKHEDKYVLPYQNHQERIFTIPISMLKKLSRKKSVSFNETVDVVLIPTRKDFSKRISNQLWYKIDELYNMRRRNQIEFAAESWNWQEVLEEDSMYLCTATREYIHPVHVSMDVSLGRKCVSSHFISLL